jgi:hypothetical protein
MEKKSSDNILLKLQEQQNIQIPNVKAIVNVVKLPRV